jgi:ABC-type uncharacterized transport system substrate-binding protein
VLQAAAHPHVFVDAQAEMIFDGQQRLAEVHHVWQFDAAFSEFAVQGLDADGDGAFSEAELKPLAEINVTSLKDFEFFRISRLVRTGPCCCRPRSTGWSSKMVG